MKRERASERGLACSHLFVGEQHQGQTGVSRQELMQVMFSQREALSVCRIHHKHQKTCFTKIPLPVIPQLLCSSNCRTQNTHCDDTVTYCVQYERWLPEWWNPDLWVFRWSFFWIPIHFWIPISILRELSTCKWKRTSKANKVNKQAWFIMHIYSLRTRSEGLLCWWRLRWIPPWDSRPAPDCLWQNSAANWSFLPRPNPKTAPGYLRSWAAQMTHDTETTFHLFIPEHSTFFSI